jgi:hypothetical protein
LERKEERVNEREKKREKRERERGWVGGKYGKSEDEKVKMK